jgi:hypothetical protein
MDLEDLNYSQMVSDDDSDMSDDESGKSKKRACWTKEEVCVFSLARVVTRLLELNVFTFASLNNLMISL